MTIEIDEGNLKSGLLGLVVALVEVINKVLEREAMRRMDAGRLREEEIDRLGRGLMELENALEHIKDENGINDVVDQIRGELDDVVEESIDLFTHPERYEVK